MKIGILGGTFDPIHNGHLALAEQAFRQLALEKIIFIPAAIPPHKESNAITPARHRYEMMMIALKPYVYCEVSDIELKKNTKVYTVDTLRELKEMNVKETQFFFLVGSDFIQEYPTWKEPDALIQLATFMIARRPGFSHTAVPQGMHVLEGDFPHVSSTTLRTKIRQREDVSHLMSPHVITYIEQHQLYQ